MDIEECLKEGFLKKVNPDEKEVAKELKESDKDLKDAGDSAKAEKYKWCIIQVYYSMFHSAKAVVLSLGYKERRHFAIEIVLQEIVKKNRLEPYFLNDFKSAMFARKEADYDSIYSKERAEQLIEIAEEFNKKMKSLLASAVKK